MKLLIVNRSIRWILFSLNIVNIWKQQLSQEFRVPQNWEKFNLDIGKWTVAAAYIVYLVFFFK